MHSKESVLGVICDTISQITPLATHRNWKDYRVGEPYRFYLIFDFL